MKVIYEVVCTYEIETESKAAAGRIARGIAQGLERIGITRSSGPDGMAVQVKTRARFKSIATTSRSTK